jgi:hypothetical protein
LGTTEKHTGFGWGNLKKRGNLEDVGIDGKIIFNLILMNRMGDI